MHVHCTGLKKNYKVLAACVKFGVSIWLNSEEEITVAIAEGWALKKNVAKPPPPFFGQLGEVFPGTL